MCKIFVTFLLMMTCSYAETMSPSEIVKFADRIIFPDQAIYKVIMTVEGGGRNYKNIELLVYKKGDKVLMRYINPPTEKGKSILMLKKKMWLYIPQMERSIPLSFKLKFEDSDFSNSDVTRVDLINDYSISSCREISLQGMEVYEIELKAKDLSLAYSKIVYQIRKSDLYPLCRQYYALSGKVMKRLTFSEEKILGGRRRPTKLTMTDELSPDNRSIIVLQEIKDDVTLDDNIFSLRYMEGGY